MVDFVTKAVPFGQGKRQPIRLEAPTWQAIDWLAGQTGLTWQQWCAAVIERTDPNENTTAAIRETAMAELLAATINAPRASLDSIADQHPLLRCSNTFDDSELAEHLRTCEVWGDEDFGGFKLYVGRDEYSRPCVWIENSMKGWPSVVLPMPTGDE